MLAFLRSPVASRVVGAALLLSAAGLGFKLYDDSERRDRAAMHRLEKRHDDTLLLVQLGIVKHQATLQEVQSDIRRIRGFSFTSLGDLEGQLEELEACVRDLRFGFVYLPNCP